MGTRVAAAGWIGLAVLVGACNDEFDFDTEPVDGGIPEASSGGDDASDAGAETDATRPPGRIECGTTTCVLPVRACCVRSGGPSCIEVAEVTCLGLLISCDSSSDCRAGSVCCATITDAVLSSVRCEAPADCTSPGQVVLCDPTDPAECTTCEPGTDPLPPGYHVCK
jgi:hypothetical protein